MYVSLLDENKNPLGLIHPALCRLLLKEKKAKPVFKLCIRHKVFIVKLLDNTYKPKDNLIYTPELTLGVDPGSGKVGFAVTTERGEVLYASQVELRNDITTKMKRRASYRRTRRNRKTKYRKPRFLNRASSRKTDKLPPTVTSKLHAHKREIEYILSIFNISRIVVEKAKFDTHSISKERTLKAWEYQKGEMYGFETVKAYVRERDQYKCQVCKKKDIRLEVHHVLERINGGTNRSDNLITLCVDCHKGVHSGEIVLNKRKVKSNTLHSTQTDVIVSQLRKWLKGLKLPKTYIFGVRTNLVRRKLGLPKKHVCDAVAISCVKHQDVLVQKDCRVVKKKCVAKGDYQLHKGKRSEKEIPTGKLLGFRKFDKVLYQGKEYFVKGKRSTGYFELMDIEGNTIHFDHTVKVENLKRLEARKSWLVA